MYIYIYRERERERGREIDIDIDIWVYMERFGYCLYNFVLYIKKISCFSNSDFILIITENGIIE